MPQLIKSTLFARLLLLIVLITNSVIYLLSFRGTVFFGFYWGDLGGKLVDVFSLVGIFIVGIGSKWAQQLETLRRRNGNGESIVPWRYSHPSWFALWMAIAVIAFPTGLVIMLSDHLSLWWIILPLIQWNFILTAIALLSTYKKKENIYERQKHWLEFDESNNTSEHKDTHACNSSAIEVSNNSTYTQNVPQSIAHSNDVHFYNPLPTPEEIHEAEMNPWPDHTMRETILRNRNQQK